MDPTQESDVKDDVALKQKRIWTKKESKVIQQMKMLKRSRGEPSNVALPKELKRGGQLPLKSYKPMI